MFPTKPPDIQKLKVEYEKRLHLKNKKTIDKNAKKKKRVERVRLERECLDPKAAADNKASLVKPNQSTLSTSIFSKLSSNFKIPKKVSAKGKSTSGSEHQPDRQKNPREAPAPIKTTLNESGPKTGLNYVNSFDLQSDKVKEIPRASPLFEVQKWLLDGEEGKRKAVTHRPPVVLEDSRNSFDIENEEEPMVIDTEEVVGSIHQIRGTNIYDGERVCGQLTELSRAMSVITEQTSMVRECGNAQEISLVLDTNVLASDLGLVDDLKRTWNGENGSSKLILVVPWVVLQELDKLKDDRMDKKPALKTLAAGAVRYLHDLLTSGDSQIRGQTIQETSEDVGWEITCNDDQILQCCFQCKKRGGGNVILFSNDRNLCNKAMVNRLQACSKETIVQIIEQIAPLPATWKKLSDISWDGRVESGSKLCSEILCQVKKTLHDILESVLKTEMCKAFEELWISVVKIKPPWRLEDILKCLQKHWIAVFGQILPKKAKEHLDIICAKFTLKQGAFGKDDLKALLIASLRFLAYFENTEASYSERVTPCIHQMRNLLDVVKNIRLATYQMKVGDNTQRTTHSETNVAQQAAPDDFVVQELEEVQQIPPNPHLHLRNTLHLIWNFMNNTCALIFDSLGMENPITYQRPDKLLTLIEARNTIPAIYSTITQLGRHLEIVLRLGEHANPEDEGFAKLAAFLDNFFFMLGKDSEVHFDENISSSTLYEFCINQETRQRLIEGFHQLEDLCNLLYRCILDVKGRRFPTQNEQEF